MFVVQSYDLAVVLCFMTIVCWGSWANTQKLAGKEWRFELFYWDYVLGVLLISLIFAMTMGSFGEAGRSFGEDLAQSRFENVFSAFLGGVVFNAANILLVAAIAVAGMAVAFPVGIGLALALGVIVNYVATPVGDAFFLFFGVFLVVLAIVLDALAYRRLQSQAAGVSRKGLLLSLACGVLMGFFYRFVAASMSTDFSNLEPGKLGPYAAVVCFSLGLLVSNFGLNTLIMKRPVEGEPVDYRQYLRGTNKIHAVGLLGGAIWGVGMMLSILASGQAGFAISYGLGQGATMIAAVWGVFIWKEFKSAPGGTNKLLALMFVFYFVGLSLVVAAKVI